MDSDDVFLLLTIAIYAITLIHLSAQTKRLLKYRHRWNSFQACFIQLSYAWSLLRLVYFVLGISDYHWDKLWKQILVYWLPYTLQFSMFSLVVLFYASLVHRHTLWESHRNTLSSIYVLSSLIQYIFVGVWIGVGVTSGRDRGLEEDVAIYAGFIYMLLSLLLGTYGYLLHKIPDGYHIQVIYQRSENSWPFLTMILLLSFMSRSVYNFCFAGGHGMNNTFHEKVAHINHFLSCTRTENISLIMELINWHISLLSQHPHSRLNSFISTKAVSYDIDYTYFLVSLCWEWIPVSLVLLFFKIPNCANIYNRRFKSGECILPSTYFIQINTDVQSNSSSATHRSDPIDVFQNPRRYDSSNETTEEMSYVSSAVDFTHSGPFDSYIPSSTPAIAIRPISTTPLVNKSRSMPI